MAMLFLRLYVELTKGAAGSAELENREIDVMTDGDYLLPVPTVESSVQGLKLTIL